MKIQSIAILRWNNDTEEPLVLDMDSDVSEFGFFQRNGVKEFLVFVGRTLAKRCPVGTHVVDHEGYHCHVVVQADGLVGVAVCDRDYPSRVALSMVRELLAGFIKEYSNWRSVSTDYACRYEPLSKALAEYQQPEKVDKIMRVQTQLDETKSVLVQTIDQVLERGQKLDELVDKSEDLSRQSKMFYKNAKKTNSCCVIS
eukprot:gb/GECG01001933.1/.p1 GENE.gb/GECG01001933.1/~~gb/GECG01001933.1/.p1  ORF type:complete len:199 (+),score=28.74 gb/GECG01001933.1/:1-597(+)